MLSLRGISLHSGYGTRLRPLTHTGPKQLISIANKPISQYVLEDLVNSEVKEIAIILGDVYPEKVKEYYGDEKQIQCNSFLNLEEALRAEKLSCEVEELKEKIVDIE